MSGIANMSNIFIANNVGITSISNIFIANNEHVNAVVIMLIYESK